MRISTQLTINDERIRELVRQEMRKFEFEELRDIQRRINNLEEADKVYRKFITNNG
jgi:hypothetical protein